MVIRKIPVYSFENLEFKPLGNGEFLKQSFYLKIPKLPHSFESEKTLLSIPNALEIRAIKRSYKDGSPDNRSLDAEGCFYFNMQDEWIVEAICKMETDDLALSGDMVLRLPLSAPFVGGCETGLYFDGTWLRFLLNGEVINEAPALDRFCTPAGAAVTDDIFASVEAAAVNNATLDYREIETQANADFFFPYGWNTNIGDVMTFTHDGVYHLIYLLDRRHHGSGPCGSHYICQLTSDNLVDWHEQKPIVQIDRPWKSCGTGTMFFHNGKYYMSYGLHTTRYGNKKEKIAPEFNEEKGEFEPISFKEVFAKGGLPLGATLSVSDDGINFKPMELLIHSAQNPSAYTDNSGKIILYCGYGGEGVFESEAVDKPFRVSDQNFNFATGSVMRNSTECPAFFEWNGYRYLIIGFTGYFRTVSPDGREFIDAAAMGENAYDALSVPMVTEFGENRRIMAGWVRSSLGWGGVLMQRELIQEENGRLGMKWVPELMPKIVGEQLFTEADTDGASLDKQNSYYVRLKINHEKATRIGISFKDGASYAVLELNKLRNTAQINTSVDGGFGEELPTLPEIMKAANPDIRNSNEVNNTITPSIAKNYALPDIALEDAPLEIRLLLRHSKRMHSTVIDAEFNGRRTMISVRDDFYPERLSIISDGEINITDKEMYCIHFEE